MSEWISVEDRLPPLNTLVLLVNVNRWLNVPDGVLETNIYKIGYLSQIGSSTINGYWSVAHERAVEIKSYTHWQPLPDPPEE